MESACAQTLGDIEIFVIDDGSTDETLSCVRKHADADSRVCVMTQENQYAGIARNKGIAEATGEYLYFLDADDWIEPNTLETLVGSAVKHGSDIVVARSEGFDNQSGSAWILNNALNGVPYDAPLEPKSYADHLFQYFLGWPWDKLFRADFVSREQLQFQPLRTTNDAYFVFCALALASRVSCCDEILFHHRSNNSKSLEGPCSKSWRCALEAMVSIDDELKDLDLYPAFRLSYCNWVMNYSYWTISTLPADVADTYLVELDAIAHDMPADQGYYPGLQERLFRELFGKARSELLSDIVPAKEALVESERIF